MVARQQKRAGMELHIQGDGTGAEIRVTVRWKPLEALLRAVIATGAVLALLAATPLAAWLLALFGA